MNMVPTASGLLVPENSKNEHLLTPATAISISRPIASAKIASMLINGERGTWPYMVYVPLSDAEGKLARFIDKKWPGSGYGCTETGAEIDYLADSAAFVIISGAALKGPLVSRRAKVAVGMVLASEGRKGAALLPPALEYKKLTDKELKPQVNRLGKAATGIKFATICLAVATHEMDPGPARNKAGNYAIGLATGALALNEVNVRILSREAREKIELAIAA